MADRQADRKWGKLVRELGQQLLLPLVFILLVLLFFHSRGRFEFSSDEGINLMKAMLVDQGYSLYGEIYNDQPPLFTYLVAGVFQVFGYKVGAARFLMLLLSSVLLWASTQMMRLIWGNGYALANACLLFVLPEYLNLSVSVMVGLPAITFAMLSLYALVLWHWNRYWLWLVLSAVALSFSVLTKLFTGFLAPIFLLGILIDTYTRRKDLQIWGMVLLPPFLWGSIFSLLFAGLVFLLVGPENIAQLLETHFTATGVEKFQTEEAFTLWWHLKSALPILVLAVIGTVFMVRERRWLFLYPLAWTAMAYLLFSGHSPVWSHHQMLITIPAASLAAIAVVEAVRLLVRITPSPAYRTVQGLLRSVSVLVILSLFFTLQPPRAFRWLSLPPTFATSGLELGSLREKFVIKMVQLAPETRWVVTDAPMFAFRAGLPVPPDLAVFTWKRLRTGNLTEADIIASVRTYSPEQVMVSRFSFDELETYLEQDYHLVHAKEREKLYIRRDLLQ